LPIQEEVRFGLIAVGEDFARVLKDNSAITGGG
jgi:hypothetical protein